MACAGKLSLLAALTLVCASAMANPDRDVQMLGNFPALQRLASKGDGAVRIYLKRVASAYKKAGYDDVGPELRRAGDLIAQFSGTEKSQGEPSSARATLRSLKRALKKDYFIALPPNVGETVPDYYTLAALFAENAGTALKNLSRGKTVSHNLTNHEGALWLIRTSKDTVVVSGSSASSGSLTVSGGGVIKTGAGTLTVTNSPFFSKTLAFPPEVELPADPDDYTLVRTLESAETISGTSFPIGTRIVRVVPSFATPAGAVEILPALFSAGAGTITFAIGTLAIFPPGIEIPDGLVSDNSFILLGTTQINDTLFPPGTRVVKFTGPAAVFPEGTVILRAPVTITPASTPAE